MNEFKIVNSRYDVHLTPGWSERTHLHTNYFTAQGIRDYTLRQGEDRYSCIAKHVHYYSLSRRIGRFVLALLLTLPITLLSFIIPLFTKKHDQTINRLMYFVTRLAIKKWDKSIRFAMKTDWTPQPLPPAPIDPKIDNPHSDLGYAMLCIFENALPYLTAKDLTKCQLVSRQFRYEASQQRLWDALKLPESAIGKTLWDTHLGTVRETPLPRHIWKLLDSPCPLSPGSRIKDTHFLLLVPETVNEKALSLNFLQQLINTKMSPLNPDYTRIFDLVANEIGEIKTPQSHWVLLTKSLQPIRNEKLLLREELEHDYQEPNVIDIVAAIFLKHKSTEEIMLPRNSDAICAERIAESHHLVSVTRYTNNLGINIMGSRVAETHGIFAARKI